MTGTPGSGVEVVAERISRKLPDVKLIALLRDPIARAVSGYVMAVRRGLEKRSVDAALSDLLAPQQLEESRRNPILTNSYVALGEYGRILRAYRSRFPAEQLLVLLTQDLADDPGGVLDDTLEVLGLPPAFGRRA
jgi:hypothetical protein